MREAGDEVAIPFRFRVERLPFLLPLLSILMYVVVIGFFSIQGRWTTIYPTLGEATASPPNSGIFAALMSMQSFVVILILSLVITWAELEHLFTGVWVVIAYVLAIITTVSLAILGNVSLNDLWHARYVGGVPFMISMGTFYIVFMVKTYRVVKMELWFARLGLIGVAIIGFLMMEIPFGMTFTAECTKKALCELVVVVALLSCFATFYDELRRLRFDVIAFIQDE